jgi:hypothetical protein
LISRSRKEEIEEIEDKFEEIIESLDAEQSYKLIRLITADIPLLTGYELEKLEKDFLIAEKSGNTNLISNELKNKLKNSLSIKVKNSVKTGENLSQSDPIHWIHRLIYSLLLTNWKHLLLDQAELIFDAVHHCEIPLDSLRNVINKNIEDVLSN